MKKIVSIFLVLMLSFSCLGAQASYRLSSMEEVHNNYTADYTFSMKIENAHEIASFLEELHIEHLDKFLDVKAFIQSLVDVNSTINVQADISKDFRRIHTAMTMESDKKVIFNRNYESSYRAKTAIWFKLDLDKKEFIIVYSTPLNEKYAVIDFAKDFSTEETDAMFEVYDKMLSRENIEKHTKKFAQIAKEHAEILMPAKKAIFRYDNDAFIAVIEDTLEYMKECYTEMNLAVGEEPVTFLEIPSLKGMKLLGEKGITIEFIFSGKSITGMSEKWDVSIDLAEIYAKTTGNTWNYNFDGNLNLTIESNGAITQVGKTMVMMPELTEENSFHLSDLFGNTNVDDDYISSEGEMEYKYFPSYTWGEIETDTFDGERYYIPLRMSIEDVYQDCSVITYDHGVVSIQTDCGVKDKDIFATLKVGESTAVVNGDVYENIGTFKLIDEKVYASVDFYEKCLGWTLNSLQKDLINGNVYYDFYTYEWSEFDFQN